MLHQDGSWGERRYGKTRQRVDSSSRTQAWSQRPCRVPHPFWAGGRAQRQAKCGKTSQNRQEPVFPMRFSRSNLPSPRMEHWGKKKVPVNSPCHHSVSREEETAQPFPVLSSGVTPAVPCAGFGGWNSKIPSFSRDGQQGSLCWLWLDVEVRGLATSFKGMRQASCNGDSGDSHGGSSFLAWWSVTPCVGLSQ